MCAVSYLNTVPLVWGLLKDPAQTQTFDLSFALPSVCADQLASGEADIGIVPVIVSAEAHRQLVDARGGDASIDVPSKTLFAQPTGRVEFSLDDFARECLVKGLDELGFLLERSDAIAAFERRTGRE